MYSKSNFPCLVKQVLYHVLFQLWLDPSKSIKKQLGNYQQPLYFRVKFYVSDPSKLHEEYTRYQFYLQLRCDILNEKLILPPSTAILLASYIVQCKYFGHKNIKDVLIAIKTFSRIRWS